MATMTDEQRGEVGRLLMRLIVEFSLPASESQSVATLHAALARAADEAWDKAVEAAAGRVDELLGNGVVALTLGEILADVRALRGKRQ